MELCSAIGARIWQEQVHCNLQLGQDRILLKIWLVNTPTRAVVCSIFWMFNDIQRGMGFRQQPYLQPSQVSWCKLLNRLNPPISLDRLFWPSLSLYPMLVIFGSEPSPSIWQLLKQVEQIITVQLITAMPHYKTIWSISRMDQELWTALCWHLQARNSEEERSIKQFLSFQRINLWSEFQRVFAKSGHTKKSGDLQHSQCFTRGSPNSEARSCPLESPRTSDPPPQLGAPCPPPGKGERCISMSGVSLNLYMHILISYIYICIYHLT